MIALLLAAVQGVVVTSASFGGGAPPDAPAEPKFPPPPDYSTDLQRAYTSLYLKPALPAAPGSVPAVALSSGGGVSYATVAATALVPRPAPPGAPTPAPAAVSKPAPSPVVPSVSAPPPTLTFGPNDTMLTIAQVLKADPTLGTAPAWSLKHDGVNTVVAALPGGLSAPPPVWNYEAHYKLSRASGDPDAHFQGAGWWAAGDTYYLRFLPPGAYATWQTVWPHCHVISAPAILSAATPEEHHCKGPVTPP